MPIDCNPRIPEAPRVSGMPNHIQESLHAWKPVLTVEFHVSNPVLYPDQHSLDTEVRRVVQVVDETAGTGFIGPDFLSTRCVVRGLDGRKVCVEVNGPNNLYLYQFVAMYIQQGDNTGEWLIDTATNELAARRLARMYDHMKTRFRNVTMAPGVTSDFIV